MKRAGGFQSLARRSFCFICKLRTIFWWWKRTEENRLVAEGGREFNERDLMVIAVKCACGKGLKLNETYAGKRVKCPVCSQILRVPSPQTPAAPHQAAGRNLQHSRTAQQANSRNAPANNPGWQTGGNSLLAAVGFAVPQGLPAVNKGAKIAIYAYIVSIAAPILLMLIGFLVPGIVLLVHVVSFACMVVILVGYFCCLQVPEEPKAKPLIMIAGLCILARHAGWPWMDCCQLYADDSATHIHQRPVAICFPGCLLCQLRFVSPVYPAHR